MKYQNTSRILCLLFHSIITLSCLALGLYFGGFVVPLFFTLNFDAWRSNLFDAPYFMYLEFAVIGFTFAILSGLGTVKAYKAVMNPKDDKEVVQSLTLFIVEGWILSLALLLQGMLLFDMRSSNSNPAFTIIMSLIFAILLLIATNIPMVKLYDGKDQNQLLSYLLTGASLFTGLMFVFVGLSLSLMATNFAHYISSLAMLLILFFQNVIAFVFFFVSRFLLAKGKSKLSGSLAASGILTLGVGLITYGAFDMVYSDKPVHFYLLGTPVQPTTSSEFGYGFPVMAIVIGAFVLVAASYIFWTVQKEKKVAVRK